ncbi:G5 domain-containing protein [Actinoplanes sp. NPDC026619]|uniref:G5 domain-containing protein n=1 Tax=Actinoplanes sp. NPDC026619 TaxID=3155798 RepID=UPI0033DA0700
MAAGAGALLIVVGGGAAGVVVLAKGGDHQPRIVTAVGEGEAAAGAVPSMAGEPVGPPAFPAGGAASARDAKPADRTATRAPAAGHQPAVTGGLNGPAGPGRPGRPGAMGGLAGLGGGAARPAAPAPDSATTTAAAPPAAPVTTTRTEVETREVPFETRLVRDPDLPPGVKQVEIPGVPGVETLRYLVTVTDGQPVGRQLIDATVTKQPQNQIVAFGTRRDRDSRCGPGLRLCVPLGRAEVCPDDGSRTESGGSVVDVELFGGVEQLTC